MFSTILITSAIVIWSVLSFVGVQRGLERKIIVYRSWADFAQTALFSICFAVSWIALWLQLIRLQLLLFLLTIGTLPWLYITNRINQRARALWIVVPARISLIVLTAFSCTIAFDCALTTLSPKAENRNRLVNAAIATTASASAWGLFRVIHRLVTDARPAGLSHRPPCCTQSR